MFAVLNPGLQPLARPAGVHRVEDVPARNFCCAGLASSQQLEAYRANLGLHYRVVALGRRARRGGPLGGVRREVRRAVPLGGVFHAGVAGRRPLPAGLVDDPPDDGGNARVVGLQGALGEGGQRRGRVDPAAAGDRGDRRGEPAHLGRGEAEHVAQAAGVDRAADERPALFVGKDAQGAFPQPGLQSRAAEEVAQMLEDPRLAADPLQVVDRGSCKEPVVPRKLKDVDPLSNRFARQFARHVVRRDARFGIVVEIAGRVLAVGRVVGVGRRGARVDPRADLPG